MSAYAKVTLRVEVTGPEGLEFTRDLPVTFALGVGDHAQTDKITCTGSASTTVTVPSGAKAMLLEPGSAVSLTWEGAGADTGTTITPASLPIGGDMFVYLGATPSVVFTNGSADDQTVYVTFF